MIIQKINAKIALDQPLSSEEKLNLAKELQLYIQRWIAKQREADVQLVDEPVRKATKP